MTEIQVIFLKERENARGLSPNDGDSSNIVGGMKMTMLQG